MRATSTNLSYFDPLNLRARSTTSMQVDSAALKARLANDFGAKQVLFFETSSEAYKHVLFDLLPQEALFFVDCFVPHPLIDQLHKHERKVVCFAHTHLADLSAQLSKPAFANKPKVILSPSLFLSTARVAPLEGMRELAKAHNAFLLIDDSATFGLAGTHFLGKTSELFGIDITLTTLPSSSTTFVTLHQSSSLTSHHKAAVSTSTLHSIAQMTTLVAHMHRERRHLQHITHLLKTLFRSHQWSVEASAYPALALKELRDAQKLKALLEDYGISTPPPTPMGHNRPCLPLFLHSKLKEADIKHLFASCNKSLTH